MQDKQIALKFMADA